MTEFHLHLVSDATGETLHSVARAAVTQFENARAVEHIWSLVRGHRQLARIIEKIGEKPGVVMFTLVENDLRDQLQAACIRLGIPCIAVLDPVIASLSKYLGVESRGQPGRQHVMNAEYFDRIEALNFTMAHDDGQLTADLPRADIVLVGISRTSKTPTSIYLANRGYKIANVPLVPGCPVAS
ncbi:MAG: pyruvate, phosphate dikinase/phosphoenolpyruvate synthase regulator, partial [Sphingomonadales bacterium]